MKIYKITCYSNCGSYFVSYLQSLTISAESPEEAKEIAKKWQRENESFLYPEDKWEIREISNVECGIIDYHIDSDY